MTPRRITGWTLFILAMLAHVVSGVAGSGAQLCVCAGGVTIERQDADCCGIEVETPAGSTGGCTDCHLIPLPDAGAASTSPAPNPPPAVNVPAPVQIAEIMWPAQPALRISRQRGHPPDPWPRMLRTVVLTC